MATGQELTPGQNAWSRDEEGNHAMATGQELTPGQNAWSRGEEGNHAMATGQELTPGQNASLDIRCEPNNGNVQQHGAQVTGFRRSTDIVINKFSPKQMSIL